MDTSADDRIQPALHALLAGDAVALRHALLEDDGLVKVVWNGNTLLEWATQPPHDVNVACIDVLIACGASLDRALGLAACWNLADLCRRLIEAGADVTSLCDDVSPITPLESAAMHGSVDAVDILATYGLHRPAPWLAAATGRLDLLGQWVSPDGRLPQGTGDYRPIWSHVGRPEAPPPSDDLADVLGEALIFAALNGRIQAVDYLLDAGAQIDAAPYRGITALHFAVQLDKPAMVNHLVARGASLTATDQEWNATPHRWAQECDDGSASRQTIVATLAQKTE